MTSSKKKTNRKAREEFQQLRLLVSTVASAQILWDRVLTDDDRTRLGDDFESVIQRQRAYQMWKTLRGCSDVRAVIETAHAIDLLSDSNREWLLRESGELLSVDEAVEKAIKSGALVIVESPRSAAFAGDEIEIDWVRHDRLWGFLWHLARHAKGNSPIDRLTFGDNSRANVVTDLKSKLTKMDKFPVTLADMITVVGKGTQKLCLPPEKIRIFECLEGTPREWHP